MNEEIYAKLKGILVDRLEANEAKFSPKALFARDLGISGQAAANLNKAVEEEFNVRISEEKTKFLTRVSGLVNYIDIYNRLREIIVAQLGIAESDILPEAGLMSDLGADSESIGLLIGSVEKEFNIQISDKMAERLVEFSDIITFIQVYDLLADTIVESLRVEKSEVKPDASLTDELGADSLEVVEMIMAVEEEFDIQVSDEKVDALKTVVDVHEFVYNIIKGQG